MTRTQKDKVFFALCWLMTTLAVVTLLLLLGSIFVDGWRSLSPDFLSQFPSRKPSQAGLKSALWGSIWVISLTGFFAIPVGIATALCLEEYLPKNKWTQFLQINISNLAGMPSIIYGLLGLAIFVRFLGLDRSIVAGSLTLALLILPVIIVASQEAIRTIPHSLKEAAHALGTYKWQVTWGHILPAALPGIMTGIILALSRAIGETAPLIVVGAFSYVAFVPQSIMDPFTTLPIQIYNWAGRPQEAFHNLAAGGIIVLLGLLLSMNFIAITIRNKFQTYK